MLQYGFLKRELKMTKTKRQNHHIDLNKIKTYSAKKRKSKVRQEDFAKPTSRGSSFSAFYSSLPGILAGSDFKAVVKAIVSAKKKRKMVIFMMGAHVIKCGLSPLVIDLMKKGVIKAVAMTGAGLIHDTELAMMGRTSEDVAEGVRDGSFGMAEETASFINGSIDLGFRKGLGIGVAVGECLIKEGFPHRDLSILAAGIKYKVPVTIHVAIGSDIVHMHPSCNGEALGEGSLIDFRNLIYSVSKLGNGGVAINFGSAVLMPEVFLKAITVARNLGHKTKDLTTANFDMLAQYRPHQNVVHRPTKGLGKGYNIIGRHEIMLPFLHRSVIEGI